MRLSVSSSKKRTLSRTACSAKGFGGGVGTGNGTGAPGATGFGRRSAGFCAGGVTWGGIGISFGEGGGVWDGMADGFGSRSGASGAGVGVVGAWPFGNKSGGNEGVGVAGGGFNSCGTGERSGLGEGEGLWPCARPAMTATKPKANARNICRHMMSQGSRKRAEEKGESIQHRAFSIQHCSPRLVQSRSN